MNQEKIGPCSRFDSAFRPSDACGCAPTASSAERGLEGAGRRNDFAAEKRRIGRGRVLRLL